MTIQSSTVDIIVYLEKSRCYGSMGDKSLSRDGLKKMDIHMFMEVLLIIAKKFEEPMFIGT